MNRVPPAPPYCSGTSIPIRPSSKYLGISAGSIFPAFSITITRGRTSSAANAATTSRNISSSSESSVSAEEVVVSACIALPDSRLNCAGTHHWIAVLASPRRFELRHVAERPVHTPFGWRMRVGGDQKSEEFRSIQRAPHLCPAEEEALLRSKAVDDRLGMRGEGSLHRRIGDSQTPEVPDVLAKRQLTLHVRGRIEHGVRIELFDNLLRLRVVARSIFLAPPVPHVAESVELPALVVEGVRHLVSDHGAHRTIIQSVIGIWIVEGRLQYSRREHDLVE